MQKDQIHKTVRDHYGNIAKSGSSCCGPSNSCCSSPADVDISKLISIKIGYSQDDVDQVPEGANLGLGCGNPVALASLKEGETVLDLGSGAGFDRFLAAARVGGSVKPGAPPRDPRQDISCNSFFLSYLWS